jgi:virginiamycin B lyase
MMCLNRRSVTGITSLIFVSFAISGCGSGGGGSSAPFQTARFTEFAAPGAGNDPTSVPGGVWPDDVAGDTDGNIWFPEHHGNAIARISPTGVFTEFPVPTPNALMDGITIDNTRQIVWVTETEANNIVRLNMATGAVTEIPMPTPGSVPGDLILAPDGTVWMTEGYEGGGGSTKIAKMNPDTLQFTEYTPTTPRNGTDGLVMMPNGDVWFVEYADNRICRFSNGVFTEFILPRSSVVPTNIARDSNLMIWVTEQQGNAIAQFNPTTSTWKEVAVPTPASDPSGVCVDKSNNVWFTEYNGSKIGVIPAGTMKAIDYVIPTPNSGPEDIQLAPDGKIIFTEQTGNKVGIISVAGLTQ